MCPSTVLRQITKAGDVTWTHVLCLIPKCTARKNENYSKMYHILEVPFSENILEALEFVF